MLSIPPGYPTNDPGYGGSNGVSIEQTVSGLIAGATYVLEFWAGGEPQAHGWQDPGVFAVDIGFGYTYLRNKPTCPGCIGTTYIIVFNATSASHTLKFTNWGHICIPCTELILDNVRLFTLAEISPSVPSCVTAPAALFSAPNNICPGTCTDFTNLSLNANSFVWSFPGATPSTSTDMNPVNICYAAPGNYDVTLIANGSAGSDTLTLSNYITVYPFPAPQGITQSGDTLFANQGSASYQWYLNGTLIPGATDYFYIASQSGNYNVVCTDANGCEVEAVIFDVIATTGAINSISNLVLYPNPASQILTVDATKLKESISCLRLFNSLGECVLLQASTNADLQSVDLKNFPSGFYWLEISAGEKTHRQEFIKQ
jgi:PKD repeat protein